MRRPRPKTAFFSTSPQHFHQFVQTQEFSEDHSRTYTYSFMRSYLPRRRLSLSLTVPIDPPTMANMHAILLSTICCSKQNLTLSPVQSKNPNYSPGATEAVFTRTPSPPQVFSLTLNTVGPSLSLTDIPMPTNAIEQRRPPLHRHKP